MTEHSSAVNQARLSESLINTARYAYNNVNEIVAVSPSLQKTILKKFGNHSKYIPNMVDLEAFGFEDAVKSSAHYKIVSIGNLIPLKAMDILIKQFAKFKAMVADSSLEIFGDGPERNNLELLIKSLNIEQSVKLNGLCARQTLAATLKRSDAFVLASRSETFGVAYIEALSCGVPVIATRCGGPEGFVHTGNGILVPVDDEEALLGAMKTMHRNRDFYNRKQIAAETVMKFSPDAVASQLEDVYQKAIEARTRQL
jgi:glycosyltransferase involved in cell wall biosynthesis